MIPAELRAIRSRLGLTQHGLAKALRMGKSGWQSVSRWEQDGNTIPGPAQVAVESLLGAWAWNGLSEQIVPQLWTRRHELTDAEWREAAPVLLGLLVAQGIETAKPPRREAGLARKGESPVAESDAPNPYLEGQ